MIYEEILLYHFPKRVKLHEERMKLKKSFIQDVLSSIHSSHIYDDQDDDYDENGL